MNLMSNAIKFSPMNGKIEMSVHSDGIHAIVAVRDSGETDLPDFPEGTQAVIHSAPARGLERVMNG